MLKMGGVFGGATESQGSGLFGGEIDEDCSLTYSQRVWGFGICFGLGWFFSFLSSFFIFQIGSKPEKVSIRTCQVYLIFNSLPYVTLLEHCWL